MRMTRVPQRQQLAPSSYTHSPHSQPLNLITHDLLGTAQDLLGRIQLEPSFFYEHGLKTEAELSNSEHYATGKQVRSRLVFLRSHA